MNSILVIDDNESHIILWENAMKDCGGKYSVFAARDAEEASDILFKGTEPHELPDVILLDSNLPGISGMEMLKMIRTGKKTGIIPVIMISSAKNPDTIREAYRAGANSCLEKPGDYQLLIEMSSVFANMWFKWNVKPKHSKDI